MEFCGEYLGEGLHAAGVPGPASGHHNGFRSAGRGAVFVDGHFQLVARSDQAVPGCAVERCDAAGVGGGVGVSGGDGAVNGYSLGGGGWSGDESQGEGGCGTEGGEAAPGGQMMVT